LAILITERLKADNTYTELLKPIPEPQQVPQNDKNVISENLAVEVEKVNSVNRKLKETNANLTTELARAEGIYPGTLPLDRVEVLGSSHEVSVSTEGIEELKRIVRIKGVKFHIFIFWFSENIYTQRITEILPDVQAPEEINCAYQGDEPDS
nr:hypothetical protein [Tanacetum cinerariifolium]